MRAGDTFIRAGKHVAADPHLWAVVSDPAKDKRLVVVNFTSQRVDKDQACVIQPGEHPFVARESVVLCAGARIVPESTILQLVRDGLLKFQAPVGKRLLAKIQRGAAKSPHLPLAARRVLQRQGIIPEEEKKN